MFFLLTLIIHLFYYLGCEEEKNGVLDLSNKGLKKLPKVEGSKKVKVLLLEENEFQKIENIDNYLAIEKV